MIYCDLNTNYAYRESLFWKITIYLLMWILMWSVFWITLSLHNNFTHQCESIKNRQLINISHLFHYSKPWWWWTLKTWTEELQCDTRGEHFLQDVFWKGKLIIGYYSTVHHKMIKWGCSCPDCEFWIALTISYILNSNLNWV